ncbi:MAG TPA: UDP-2,3-diacylglucosamine diphosphatase [Casimicrobiaceae bacterium]|jgi:UDP-2,3-diacylglucosamine hydrolase
MKPALVLSDLHLSATRPAAVDAFHALARGPAQHASAVYILGDLFDSWLGDDQLSDPLAASVAASIRSISDSGVPVFFARGNRDFLLGERFERATGARLLPEQHVVALAGTPTLLLHGDELCTGDVDYQRYRARIRTPQAARRLLALPYFVRRLIAWYLRRKSLDANALKPESIMDVSDDAVADAFRRHDVHRMIHGHTHRPARHAHAVDGSVCERVVLADWHDRGHYLEIDETGMREREIAG